MADIGLPIDKTDVLTLPPSVVLYGPPGIGKTTEMARAFQRTLYVQSSPSILHAYAVWAKDHPEEKLLVPERMTLDERTCAQHYNNSVLTGLVTVLQKYIASCDSGTCPYEGIVFDEWNTLAERIFAELKADPHGRFRGRNGNPNIFAVFDAFKAIHRQVLMLGRRTRRMVGFVAHHQPPKIDEDENSPTKGLIKHLGGPKMPMGLSDQVIEICADADVVLQLAVKEPTAGGLVLTPDPNAPPPSKEVTRWFMTQLDTKYFRKVRGGFNLAPEEPLDIHKNQGLRELLRRAGFPV